MENISRIKKTALTGVLLALMLALSYIERFIPLGLAVPVPGVKLGLANIVTVGALYWLGSLPALMLVLARCLLSAVFGGNAAGALFSLCGGVFSWLSMSAAIKSRFFSVYGISILGAAFHNMGQILAAVLILGGAVVYYLPYLLLVSLFTGTLTGAISAGVISRVRL